jgi:single-strand DNA-binding protein
MADIFKVIGTGRLTRDMEIKYTTGGMAIGNFAIAVNRRTKKGDAWQDEASFFDCKLFGKSAEGINQYMTKGKQVAIDGTLTQERWEKDGQNHSKTVIICDTVHFSDRRTATHNKTQAVARHVRLRAFPIKTSMMIFRFSL